MTRGEAERLRPASTLARVTDGSGSLAASLVEDIATDVARRRANGEYPNEALARLHAEFDGSSENPSPESCALLQSWRPIESAKPVVGDAIVLAKRVARRLLSWYVDPIAVDQTEFNHAITSELRALERRVARTESVDAPFSSLSRTGLAGQARSDRGRALAAAVGDAPPGTVALFGDEDGLLAGLDGRHLVTAHPGSCLDGLGRLAPMSASAVVLAGVLPRLTVGELLAALPAAVPALAVGGRVVVDFPDGGVVPPGVQPSDVDPSMCRFLTASSLALLCEAAGLDIVSTEQLPASPVPWSLTVVAPGPALSS
jgi:hypothetical protein